MRAGGIGACSVGTYRKNFSVTFRQQRAEDIAPAFEAISRFAQEIPGAVSGTSTRFVVQTHSHLHPIACNTLR